MYISGYVVPGMKLVKKHLCPYYCLLQITPNSVKLATCVVLLDILRRQPLWRICLGGGFFCTPLLAQPTFNSIFFNSPTVYLYALFAV